MQHSVPSPWGYKTDMVGLQLAPVKFTEHKGYKNTTRDMKISTQHFFT